MGRQGNSELADAGFMESTEDQRKPMGLRLKAPRVQDPYLAIFRASWIAKYGPAGAPAGPKAIAMARQQAAKCGLCEAEWLPGWQKAVLAYFRDPDRWVAQEKHPLAGISGRLSKYLAKKAEVKLITRVGGPKPGASDASEGAP